MNNHTYPKKLLKQVIKVLPIFYFTLAILTISAVYAILIWKDTIQKEMTTLPYPEIQFLAGKNYSYKQYETYFMKIAQEKGGRYAFDVMKFSKLKPNIDTHLIGHSIGELWYEQEGIVAMQYCTDDFKSACSHAIILGYLYEEGDSNLEEIRSVCEGAPGGSNGYAQCVHGFGHAILAFKGYSLEDAIPYCTKIATKRKKYSEEAECVGGMIMEIMIGGGHDTAAWKIQRAKYVSSKDPLALCKNDLIPERGKRDCYIYNTSQLYKAAGKVQKEDMSDSYLRKVMNYCKTIPKEEHKNGCYHGLGISFVGQTSAIDFTRVDQTSNEELKQIYHRCSLATEELGKQACNKAAVGNLYWSGKNDIGIAIRYCNLISEQANQQYCFEMLMARAKGSKKSQQYYKNACAKFPGRYQGACVKELIKTT